ncbi:hypothetical protein BCEN4_520123 [Burkholderia cenocepacia]|nr:hypothetical protein BCEN4_520123 [Burkholderia cenocepacia]
MWNRALSLAYWTSPNIPYQQTPLWIRLREILM